MWPDNEADIDLLGFDYLVDELEIVLTEPRLLPVTVGVAGEWGSGKSSLMRLARRRLEGEGYGDRYVCVDFSPWRHEDADDIKAALIATVMDALAGHLNEADVARPVRDRIERLRRWAHGWALPGTLASTGALLAGLDPELAAATGTAAQAVSSIPAAPAAPSVPAVARSFESVSQFHIEFAHLMDELEEQIDALVVFVDDLDRCLTPAIVATFEAIRLFLQAPRTAYVVGAHQRIIQAALDDRYPRAGDGAEALGIDYLEKVLQVTIAIPPLAGPEALTYVNLLFAELYTDDAEFSKLLTEAQRIRANDQLAEAMNHGIAEGVLGQLPENLVEAFELVDRVGPPLAGGTRGNPRQLKRFLNTLLLRQRTALKRKVPIRPGILAKLMLLEERHVAEFERIYQWQLAAEGAPAELAVAEQLARGGKAGKAADEVKDAATEFKQQPGMEDWLRLEPSLAGVALGPYFSLARDKLSTATPATRLPSHIQELVVAAQAGLDRDRDAAIALAAELTAEDQARFATALFGVATREPDGNAMSGAAALAAVRPEVADAFFSMLGDIPTARVPQKLPGALMLRFKNDPRMTPLLDVWIEGPVRLKAAVELIRKKG